MQTRHFYANYMCTHTHKHMKYTLYKCVHTYIQICRSTLCLRLFSYVWMCYFAWFDYVCLHWFLTHTLSMFICVYVRCICYLILGAKCVHLRNANSISWQQCHFCHFSQCIQNIYTPKCTHTHSVHVHFTYAQAKPSVVVRRNWSVSSLNKGRKWTHEYAEYMQIAYGCIYVYERVCMYLHL